MFKPIKEQLTPQKAQELWKYLSNWERRLRRNVLLCRIIQPLGAGIFLFNMLLVTMNLFLFIGGETIVNAMDKVPLLPSMVEGFPRGSLSSVLIFSFCFAFLIPLAVSGIVLCVLLLIEMRKKQPEQPLVGSEAECAKALAYRAETVYSLRKKLPKWSIFMETSILTALTAWPILCVCLGYAGGDDPAVLQIALACFAMLVCLFVFFWVFALLFFVFAQLNALFYLSPSEWKLWELFNDLDDHWESVDPEEYARRERVAAQRGRRPKN